MGVKINSDLASGIVLIALSALFLTVLIPIGVQIPEGEHLAVLAPDFWIKIIVWTLLALGIFLLVEGVMLMKQQSESTENASSEYRPFPFNVGYVVVAIALLFVYYIGISVLGMMVSSMIALLVFTRISGENRWKIIIPIALIQPVLLYYFFLKVAGIPMPLGIFE